MRQISTSAVIYKIMRYMDSSAIALAVTPDYGKIKLFMTKAFSKKGGVMKFTPGTVVYNAKETSDLNKFVSFAHAPEYYHYHSSTEIICRQHLLFDYFDHLFETGQGSRSFWKLILKFDDSNYRELSAYTMYRLLKDAGLMFELFCSNCGVDTGDMLLNEGRIYCKRCGCEGEPVDDKIMNILRAMTAGQPYRSITLTQIDELGIYEVFDKHINSLFSSKELIKSYEIFKSLVFLS